MNDNSTIYLLLFYLIDNIDELCIQHSDEYLNVLSS